MGQVKLLKISADGVPLEFDSTADEITLLSGKFGNIKVSGNLLESTDANGNMFLTPNGTGNLVLDGVNWPQADGTVSQILKTDGAGQTSWVDAFASLVANSYTADEALAARDALYISAADNVSKASASSPTTSNVVGFAKAAAADTASVEVASEGVLSGFSGLTAGARYYLSATSGAITPSIPVGVGNTIVQVGYAKSTTALHIQIESMGRRA